MSRRAIRIANCSGYSGDRREAIREILDGGPVDVIAGDYLAEVTIAGMAARRMRERGVGFSEHLLVQLEGCMEELLERGIKLVVNAGGFDPAALASRLRELSAGRTAVVAHLDGDDLLSRLGDLQAAGHELRHLDTGAPIASWGQDRILSASAYLGAWGIADALTAGADIVVCPRVTDASLIVGPAAWWHGWDTEDWDRLAGAVVAGHIIECGPQATGGNFSGFQRIPGIVHPGFPIAEIDGDGSSIITKHPGTGGAVDVDTVTAQLLYEIQGPIYLNPDVTADLRRVALEQIGPDRVAVSGAVGSPPPPTAKVAITAVSGWENSFFVYLCGLDVEAKAALMEAQARDALRGSGVTLARVDLIGRPAENPESIEAATCTLRFVGRAETPDPLKPGGFYTRVHSLILAGFPGFHAEGNTGRTTRPSPLIQYWPALLDANEVQSFVVHQDGDRQPVRRVPTADPPVVPPDDRPGYDDLEEGDRLVDIPLGRLTHARAGDKGGNSNVGFWTDERRWPWLRETLTTSRMRELFPEAAGLPITRHELPALRAVHFVIHGNLGDGCTSNGRLDALGKSVGEFLRARRVRAPLDLVHDELIPTARDAGSPALASERAVTPVHSRPGSHP